MIEKILKLKFKGGFFLEETTIPFFKNNEERINIIYGKNGSGKSTNSKAVMKASGYSIGEDYTASFLTADDNIVSLPEEKCVYVFNEQYIIDNVRIKNNGLDTIVIYFYV